MPKHEITKDVVRLKYVFFVGYLRTKVKILTEEGKDLETEMTITKMYDSLISGIDTDTLGQFIDKAIFTGVIRSNKNNGVKDYFLIPI